MHQQFELKLIFNYECIIFLKLQLFFPFQTNGKSHDEEHDEKKAEKKEEKVEEKEGKVMVANIKA